MSSRHLVDPELVSLLDTYQPLKTTRESLPASRSERAAMVAALLAAQPPDEVEKSEHLIAGASGAAPVRVLVYTPCGAPRDRSGSLPAYLNLHGGGLVGGLPEQDEAANRRLAGALGCVVVSPEYRLAPETPYPGPLEDCCAAFDWMLREAVQLGIDRERIALGGSSAGGCLAAGLALFLRDRDLRDRDLHDRDWPKGRGAQPMFLFLVFPMLDDRTGSTRPAPPLAGEFIWTAAHNRFGWAAYLNAEPGAAEVSLYAAPARAESLAGLPPTWIGCGALDLFVDENLEFTRRLVAAGVPAELHVYPGAYHAFQWVAEAQVTKAFARDSLSAFRRAFAGSA